MFSRLAITSSNTLRNSLSKNGFIPCCIVRVASTQPATAKSGQVLPFQEGPERDLANFPREKRPKYSGKVRLGFLPEEWFTFFYPKTGVTGPYVFGAGLITYLLSKEIYVIEHEFYTGVSLAMLFIYGIKAFGPKVGEFGDKLVKEYEDGWNAFKESGLKGYRDGIELEKKSQESARGQTILFDAKRENVQLQLEAEYRKRLLHVYTEVKKRMDYQLEKASASRRIEQNHMVNWIVDHVIKGITPQQEKEALQKCISDLKSMAVRA